LFRQQRKRRAFAFVLSKWDRCAAGSATGVRPDEDLRRDLEAEGFSSPLLFRTCAQLWLDRASGNGEAPAELPEGEQFRGLLAWYLQLGTRARYVGSSLREKIPFVSRARPQAEAPPSWDLSLFTSACTDVAANRQLDARGKALGNRLLVDANAQGYPLEVLTGPVDALGTIDWRHRWARALMDVLTAVEKEWTRPRGARRAVQG